MLFIYVNMLACSSMYRLLLVKIFGLRRRADRKTLDRGGQAHVGLPTRKPSSYHLKPFRRSYNT
jgi:hypothetical protein